MREAAKANKQIEGIICCERLNGTGWPIGLDCWNRCTSSNFEDELHVRHKWKWQQCGQSSLRHARAWKLLIPLGLS